MEVAWEPKFPGKKADLLALCIGPSHFCTSYNFRL